MKCLIPTVIGLGLVVSAAQAHAAPEPGQARFGSARCGGGQIAHGCDGRPITVAEASIGTEAMPEPGRTPATTGASQRGTAPVPRDRAAGGDPWSEILRPGQDGPDLTAAAPARPIVRTAQAGGANAAPVKAGDLTIETPWLRATPNGAKVAGGYVRITNTGSTPDTLTGAAVPFAMSGDIHSMSMAGGVMKMAPVSGGLTIKPGETVELKPGGYHLMFEGLTGAPKAGDTVAGTLTFQRAGAVPVTFSVAPIGATAPGGQHQHQH